MSVTYGFYNSVNGDRKYDAVQISSMFDGLITDGIFASIGDAFVVKANDTSSITVGTGKAWFNRTWTLNDAVLPIAMPAPNITYKRIDAVVIEVDSRESFRTNSIKVIEGTPASNPKRPVLTHANGIDQYALAYIERHVTNSTSVSQRDITSVIGSSETPFVVGVQKSINIDSLMAQWQGQSESFFSDRETEFTAWFDKIKGKLGEDAATNLQNQINDLRDYANSASEDWLDVMNQTIEEAIGGAIEEKY